MNKPLSLLERRLAARVPVQSEKLVTFLLAGRWFALPLASVCRIFGASQIYWNGPESGYVDFAGEAVPLVDYRRRLGADSANPQDAQCAAVIETRQTRIALALEAQPVLRRVRCSEYKLTADPRSCLIAAIPAQSEHEPPLLVIDCEQLVNGLQ